MGSRVGIDIRMIRHTGIGTYIRELLSGYVNLGLEKKLGLLIVGPKPKDEKFSQLARQPFRSGIYSVWEQLEYPLRLRHCALWHAPHYNIPLRKGKTKLLVTIHDLIHWIFRKEFFNSVQAFYAQQMLQRAVRTADHVITVSQQTRSDLVKYFDADPEHISVIYEGVGSQFQEWESGRAEAVLANYRLPAVFFLYVGSMKPHKNVLGLLNIFERLRAEKKTDASLVLVGKKDKHYAKSYEKLASLKTGNGIVYLPKVSSEELVALYNRATALVHPSLYEGFGLTLLEAMACGTPVIAARTSAIPEVVGDAALLVDPCAQKEMEEAMVRVEHCPNLREELKRKGLRHVQRFRWEETAAKTAEVYERILASS